MLQIPQRSITGMQLRNRQPFFQREFGGARVCSDLSQAIARKPGTGRDFDDT